MYVCVGTALVVDRWCKGVLPGFVRKGKKMDIYS